MYSHDQFVQIEYNLSLPLIDECNNYTILSNGRL